jgi:hypothetical protein
VAFDAHHQSRQHQAIEKHRDRVPQRATRLAVQLGELLDAGA